MTPSPWIERFGPLVAHEGPVLDVACGAGRHTRLFRALGHRVVAVDRDLSAMRDLEGDPDVELLGFDLELGAPFPVPAASFAGVVVTNYLWRSLFDELVRVLAPGGCLLYETFAEGNERYGRPTNPDHLLRPGELLDVARRHQLHVVAYEDVVVDEPRPAALQRLAATRARRTGPGG
jgi:SAM-dependent methyltransferase